MTELSELAHEGARDTSLDGKARRAAAKSGLQAQRPRGRSGGGSARGFALFDRDGNCVAGDGYTLSAEDVIRYCDRIPS